MADPCACSKFCGDDGDVDGPGVCKALPRSLEPPLVEIVMVPRDEHLPPPYILDQAWALGIAMTTDGKSEDWELLEPYPRPR